MTDFTVDSKATPGQDTRWRAGRLGVDEARPGTLDLTAFTSGTHYGITGSLYGADVIPSGVAVAKNAAGNYVPFDPAAGSEGDPRRVLAGFINDDAGIPVKRESGATSTKSTFSLLITGIIDAPKLPIVAQRTSVLVTRTTAPFASGTFTYVS